MVVKIGQTNIYAPRQCTVVVGVVVRHATATHVFVKIMAISWSDAETVKVIELWGEQGVQEQLEGSKWNRNIYAKLYSELAKHWIEKSDEQCRCKVKKLCQEYKKIKDKHNKTGRGRTNWKFYNILNELLRNRPATCSPLVVDTANDTLVVKGNDELSDGCDDAIERDNSLENVEDNGTSAVAAVEISSEPSSSRSTTPDSS